MLGTEEQIFTYLMVDISDSMDFSIIVQICLFWW